MNGVLIQLSFLFSKLMYWMIVLPVRALAGLFGAAGRTGRPRPQGHTHHRSSRPATRQSRRWSRTEVWRFYRAELERYVGFVRYERLYPQWHNTFPHVPRPHPPVRPVLQPMPWSRFNHEIAAMEAEAYGGPQLTRALPRHR
ncbi:hypothetical protein [Actinocatenispora rupis]|uniref:Uncharacterized protein n=1 Tax=Actinocatenispora rupis TaxID=519421 RepID=A0A8J3J711_9ACTN|nr:hypothetical protein [Actinocatenispora rupis]GID15293.1 hypothetical protein Aru02nite_61820 [Actinocatenispora rupis]